MSFEPLSVNAQYAIGGARQFPNPNNPYKTLEITNSKARRDQRATRKIEGITTQEKRYRRLLSSKNASKRRIYKQAVDNILRHQYDQSILASEHGAFPILPKAAVAGQTFPARGVSVVPRLQRARRSRGKIRQPLKTVFTPTHFMKITDLSITTPTLVLSGREQPYGGTEGSPTHYIVPLYRPNAAYGGTIERYQ